MVVVAEAQVEAQVESASESREQEEGGREEEEECDARKEDEEGKVVLDRVGISFCPRLTSALLPLSFSLFG